MKIYNVQTLVPFLQKNPYWISAFVCGEGCFTSSFLLDKRAYWGIWPQVEFNITQSSKDLLILEAIQKYFNCGSIHKKGNGEIYQ